MGRLEEAGMKFPCKECGAELFLRTNMISDLDFLSIRCDNCGKIREYSRVRIMQIPEKT